MLVPVPTLPLNITQPPRSMRMLLLSRTTRRSGGEGPLQAMPTQVAYLAATILVCTVIPCMECHMLLPPVSPPLGDTTTPTPCTLGAIHRQLQQLSNNSSSSSNINSSNREWLLHRLDLGRGVCKEGQEWSLEALERPQAIPPIIIFDLPCTQQQQEEEQQRHLFTRRNGSPTQTLLQLLQFLWGEQHLGQFTWGGRHNLGPRGQTGSSWGRPPLWDPHKIFHRVTS